MKKEVLKYLKLEKNGLYVDCTLGGCGHAELILKNIGPEGKLIGIDHDKTAIENANKVLSKYLDRIILFKTNFSNIKKVLKKAEINKVNGILADLGVSSHHFDEGKRGFSFNHDGPLDMRMDKDLKLTAYNIVNEYSSSAIFRILKIYGEEKFASKITSQIVRAREKKAVKSTRELASLVKDAVPAKFSSKMKIHPATKTFMALRIEVNKELEALETFLNDAPYLLKKNGRLCILNFTSAEDKIVMNKFKELSIQCKCPPKLPVCVCGGKSDFKLITRKPLRPENEEIISNPRARSTKLRVLEKI